MKRIESASSTVTSFLESHYGLPLDYVFLQGSYANGTAVKPVDGGEYDVDIVCVCASEEQTPAAALRDLFEALDGNGLYSGKLVEKQPCVRIEYADDAIGGFHVDVVPARASAADAAPLDAPRRTSGWHPTVPREYTQWCEQQGEHFCRLVQMLKRWRDEHQDVRRAVTSIVLQVLLSEYIAVDAADDSQRVAQSILGMNAALQPLTSPPPVLNPVLETENLAARWTSQAFADFKRKLSEAAEIASAAIHADDLVEQVKHWQELFGDDFPSVSKDVYPVELADTSHAESPRAKGWQEALDPRFGVTIKAWSQRAKRANGFRTTTTAIYWRLTET